MKQFLKTTILVALFALFSATILAQEYKKMTYTELDSVFRMYEVKGAYKEAMPCLEEGMTRAKQELGEVDSIHGLFVQNLGNMYNKIGNYHKALELYTQGLDIHKKIYKEGHKKLLLSMSDLANVYNTLGRFDESEKLFLKGIAIQKQQNNTQTSEYAISLNSLAFLYYGLGKYELTLSLLLESSKIWKEVKGEKDAEYAKSLLNMGYVNQIMLRYEEAESLFMRAGSIWKETLGEEHPNYFSYLEGLAYLNKLQDKYEASESLYLQILALRKKSLGEQHPDYAYSLERLAALYISMKRYEEAEKVALESIAIFKLVFGENHAKYAQGLSTLALLYQIMKRYEESDKLYVECIKIQTSVYGRASTQAVRSIGNYANLKLKRFQYKETEKLYLEIAAIDSVLGVGSELSQLIGFCNLSYLYAYMGRYEDSKSYYYKSILANCKDTTLTRSILEKDLSVLVGKKFISTSEIILALDVIYRTTQTQLDSTGVKDEVLLKYGYSALQVAIQISENLRNGLEETGKLRILKQINGLATKAIDRGLMLSKQDNDIYIQNSFSYAELNKSILLADAIKGDRARSMGDLPDSLIFYEIELEKNKKKLEKEELDAKTDSTKNVVLKKQNELNLEIAAFLKKIKDKYPKYHALKYENITAKAADIQALLEEKTMMLEYFVADSTVYLFALTKKDLKLYEIPISKNTLGIAIGQFRNALSNYKFIISKKDQAYEAYNNQAFWFYEELVKPALEKSKVENLIIIADGELGHLPFEAFLVEKGVSQNVEYKKLHYLIKDYNVSYNYSATLWKENRQSTPLKNNGQMLACAASYHGVDSSLIDKRAPYTFNCRANLNPLPEVQKEVSSLEMHFKGDFLSNYAANEAFFKKNAANYGIIHLAMHGILHPRTPMLSSLAFTENQDSLEDNFLHAHEISKLKLNADLVVLSACETGYGQFEQGEGVLSLARSFMYAGVHSLVVSLWQVNDGSTAAIMTAFYDNLANGMSKDIALRQAKLEYLDKAKGLTAHPAFWSPFIQLGDNRPISIKKKGGDWAWWLGGAALLLMIGGGIAFSRKKKG